MCDMDRDSLRKSIDDWDSLLRSARKNLVPRAIPAMPQHPFGTALLGVRRCGKTYSAIQMSLRRPVEEVLYYNFEDPTFVLDDSVSGLDVLLDVAAEVKGRSSPLLILDEIQNVHHWERWVRKILDQRKHEVIVTGSSAKLLGRELATALTGRCLESRVYPLSLAEYGAFTGVGSSTRRDRLAMLSDYLQWGGFPEVALAKSGEQKQRILQQYLTDIVLKDVLLRTDVRNRRALNQIVTFYLTNPSSLHSYSALKKAFGIGTETAAEITHALADAFLVFEVERYHANLKVQSRDPKKLYLVDTGLRQAGARSPQQDTGKLLENAVFVELLRRGAQVSYFKGEREVDFVVTEQFRPTAAIQVCASDLSDPGTAARETAALLECLAALGLGEGTIVTWDREQTLHERGKTIHLVPAYKWLTGPAA